VDPHKQQWLLMQVDAIGRSNARSSVPPIALGFFPDAKYLPQPLVAVELHVNGRP
jgi:hypothetical protein